MLKPEQRIIMAKSPQLAPMMERKDIRQHRLPRTFRQPLRT